MSKGNPFLALRLTPGTLGRLRELSARQGRTVADIAREALARGLSADDADTPVAAALVQGLHRVARRPSRPRKRSRIERATQATEELRQLLAEYAHWLDCLPEFAEGTTTAVKLQAAVEALEEALNALDQLDLPRGFGRD
jgi:predicted DNA-binding protein